ncbi:MAG: helix-turn-helix domain-containing protein [Ilumatobacteraceae bacterium]|jgi:excisionase family DNA binding protein|nr:helix-turn-helix domain-containing protein [Ilumatobacteraceae bacterium]
MPTRRQLDTPPSNSAPPDLLTVAETAAVLRCGLTFVYESIHRYRATGDADEIPGLKVGRGLRVPRVRLEHYIGAPITWPIAEHPTVDHQVGHTDCDDDTRSPSPHTTTRHPRRTTRRPTTPRLFED